MSTTQWADRYRYLSSEASARPGKYSSKVTPWIPGIHDALDDARTWKVVCMKSAQVAWTDGVVNNWLGRIIDIDPSPVIGLFAKEGAAKDYGTEKLGPMVEATPRLDTKLDVRTSRKDGNRALFKKFQGGFLKLVGSNSPSNVKSTPAPRVFVEEPDDVADNVGQQGDSIKLLEERTKTYHRRKVVFGGTPSIKGLSRIEHAHANGDQRQFLVPCHECGDDHALHWDNVHWTEDPSYNHPNYGPARPETAVYACPHCGVAWNDAEKNRNVTRGRWEASAEFRGIASFSINELYSPFPGSTLCRLVERYLEAKQQLESGDDTAMIVFVNSALGLPYEYKSDAPEPAVLAERALAYAEKTVPAGGLVLTAGVDVQHNRLAIVIRAWGRNEESWLVYWGEIAGACADSSDPVWRELDQILEAPYPYERGGLLSIQALNIDSSDGKSNDAVYKWVRARQSRGVRAIKGANNYHAEIFSLPRKVDTDRSNTKAAKYGLKVWLVGTEKAKDLIDSRLKLTGTGPGRMHAYETVRADYWEQVLGEIKAPSRVARGRKVWQEKTGVRNEGLDCEVYALHAARALKLHVKNEAYWNAIEQLLMQPDLFGCKEKPQPLPAVEHTRRPGRRVRSAGVNT